MYCARMLNKALFIALVTIAFVSSEGQSYFPETGPEALYQRALDTRSRLNVLYISLQPGYEDFSSLAYFRFAHGAKIVTAYLTNGEAGESDVRGEYPLKLAAIRREEAAQAMEYLDGAALFLNFPDIAAARDPAAIRAVWHSDTLQLRLMKLLSDYRPDVIILSRDWAWGEKSLRWKILQQDLMQAVKRLEPPTSAKELGQVMGLPRWAVERIWIDEGKISGASLPTESQHPLWKKSYAALGEEAAQRYSSLAMQRAMWKKRLPVANGGDPKVFYDLMYPQTKSRLKTIDQNLPRAVAPSLRWTEQALQTLTTTILKTQGVSPTGSKAKPLLVRLTAIMDTLDLNIAKSRRSESIERKILLQWKLGLEDLRTSLLGVKVQYTLSDNILTQRQLTMFKVDTVTGISPGGVTEIFFPFVDQGWIINEAVAKRLPLQLHKEFRLISPAQLDYNTPHEQYGLTQSSVGSTLMVFIIHKGAKREESFVHRTILKMFYAPRFVTEILTPIVRAIPSEQILVKLTNHSRDGVRDRIYVSDSLVSSSAGLFRLNIKDQSHLDTLKLTWKRPLQDGTYALPVYIGQDDVGRFAARKFETKVDSTKRIALITGIEYSPTEEALRRLGVQWKKIQTEQKAPLDFSSNDIIIIDRRALTFQPQWYNSKKELEQFVAKGGHLIVLAQDAEVWNEKPLIDGMILKPTSYVDENIQLSVDSTQTLLSNPNAITGDDWTNWLYRKGYNTVSGHALENAAIPIKTADGQNPLLITWKKSLGKITYVELALQPQFMNIHPGAFRLLANLLSY